MKASENIKWIFNDSGKWNLYKNKSNKVRIQKSDPDREYNVSGNKGVVYNFLEDSYEKIGKEGYIVTGVVGEMWPIGSKALSKYNIKPEEITYEAKEVDTVELETVYAAVKIPLGTEFWLETDYGEKALLKGNRSGIEHGTGDFVLVTTKLKEGVYEPDFEDSGRIINGKIFDQLYRKF